VTDGGPDWTFRRPTPADHPAVSGVVDEWWGGRHLRHLLPRLWFDHFAGSSWIVEDASGRLAAFLVGFVSPDHPDVGYVHMIATSPNHRGRGLGRKLYERFFADVAAQGVREVRAVTWPGNRGSVGFHRAMGFEVDDAPGTQRLYGTPAYPDDDGEGEDRVRFRRTIAPG